MEGLPSIKKRFSTFIMKYIALIVCLFLTLAKLWLTRSQPLHAISSSVHDDILFLTLANHIINGEWLGPYNSLTLIKGPFYPIWVALINKLGLPLLLSEQIFYAFSCFILSISLKPVLKTKRNISILYILLLFNPASFDVYLARPIRNFIYASLTIWVVGCAIGILTAQVESKPTRYWALGLGASLGCFWLTREEGLWIVPLLVTLFTASFLFYFQRNNWNMKHLSSILKPWFIAGVVFLLFLNTIKYINFTNYGVFAKTEFDTYSTQAAYGALIRVKPAEIKKYVPITRKTMREIYEVSPAFAELSNYFEGYMGRVFWPDQGISVGRDSTNRTEILGGWFFWAFRDAIANAGYYSNGKYPEDFYLRVATEINLACASGKLNCYKERTTLMPIFHLYYLKYIIPYSFDRVMQLVNFKDISVNPIISQISDEEYLFFRRLTNEKIYLNNPSQSEYLYFANDQVNIVRTTILEAILKAYQLLFPVLFFSSLVGFVLILSQWIKKHHGFIEVTILISVILSIITRTGLLSLLDITTLDIPISSYLHSLYPLMILFIVLTVIECSKYLFLPSKVYNSDSV